jgi:saccharopine dehydrogenase-like NADP-dependent oxidoreductase
MNAAAQVLVYGATGHTGRFVVAELRRRGFDPVLSGRSAEALEALSGEYGRLAVRPAGVTDADALDRALAGVAAVVNCAGPFAVTAAPVLAAALRARVPYVDVAAEIEANAAMFADHADAAQQAQVSVLPAMAFFGGLGDLLVTAAMREWTAADEAHVAYGLSSWHPTPGTRTAGQVSHERRGGRRVRFTDGALEYHDDPPREQDWDFPAPLGRQAVIADFTMADVVTIPSHLSVPRVRTYMSVAAAGDLLSRDSPPPKPVDDLGRSDQRFVVDAVVCAGGVQRRVTARGQDIYAVTAPLAVEAVERMLSGRTRTTGVASAGASFDAVDFLRALSPHVEVDLPE